MRPATMGKRLTECFCDSCLCALPSRPVRGYCAECMKLDCWRSINRERVHFLHDQCQEYFDSVVEELAE